MQRALYNSSVCQCVQFRSNILKLSPMKSIKRSLQSYMNFKKKSLHKTRQSYLQTTGTVCAVVWSESHLRWSLMGACFGAEKLAGSAEQRKICKTKRRFSFFSQSLCRVLSLSHSVYIPALLITQSYLCCWGGVFPEIIWWPWEQLVPVVQHVLSTSEIV